MKKLNALLLLNFMILSISAQETTMSIDTQSSSLNWIGKKLQIVNITAHLNLFLGT